MEGACLCGAVRFEVSLPALYCGHCHCSMCRRAHGAAYVTWVGVAKRDLRVLEGAGLLAEYQSSDKGRRSFCSSCGSQLFCDISTEPDTIDVVLTAIDNDSSPARSLPEPQAHVFFDCRAGWTVTPDDGLPRLGGADGMQSLDDDA